MLTLSDVYNRAKLLDEITLLEVLKISSEDIVERFQDFIEENYEELIEEFADEASENEE